MMKPLRIPAIISVQDDIVALQTEFALDRADWLGEDVYLPFITIQADLVFLLE